LSYFASVAETNCGISQKRHDEARLTRPNMGEALAMIASCGVEERVVL